MYAGVPLSLPASYGVFNPALLTAGAGAAASLTDTTMKIGAAVRKRKARKAKKGKGKRRKPGRMAKAVLGEHKASLFPYVAGGMLLLIVLAGGGGLVYTKLKAKKKGRR